MIGNPEWREKRIWVGPGEGKIENFFSLGFKRDLCNDF